ncbi:uncharacterized protein LOC135137290 [Zophobas morio]|uniref:uncharacterized protein LOC135137290 n=1 Tax=Zophobas morio TaxID=2755281 RepID=UPI003082D080
MAAVLQIKVLQPKSYFILYIYLLFVFEIAYKNFKQWSLKKGGEIVGKRSYSVFRRQVPKRKILNIVVKLKATININENIFIKQYSKLVSFLKKKSVGYRAKKSKVLTRDDVQRFLGEADDENYLLMKVALIFGILGAMRRDELTKLTVDNFEDRSLILVVKIPDSKTYSERTFTITYLEMLTSMPAIVSEELRPPFWLILVPIS